MTEILLIAASALLACSSTKLFASAPGAPTGLMLGVMKDDAEPVLIVEANIRFSWIVNDARKDAKQRAYQIIVASGKSTINADNGDMWNSGIVASGESCNIAYQGGTLQAGCKYYWKVKTWDRDNVSSPFSAPGAFIMSLDSNQWVATPIWSFQSDTYVFLRKEVTLPSKPIDYAIAFVTGRHPDAAKNYTYKFFVNGALVGLGPHRANNGRVTYNAYDITGFLKEGHLNAFASANKSLSSHKDFLCQVLITYSDGTSQLISTDNTWKALPADNIFRPFGTSGGNPGIRPYYNNPFESIDATQLPSGWQKVGFNDDSWASAAEHSSFSSTPTLIRNLEIKKIPDISVARLNATDYDIDLKVHACGFLVLDLKGTAPNNSFTIKIGGWRDQDIEWKTKGGDQVIEEFGYVLRKTMNIRGYEGSIPLAKDNVTFYKISAPFDENDAHFSSSNELLNQIFRLCKNSIAYDIIDVYMDSPDRQRSPFPGDGTITMRTNHTMSRDYATGRYSMEYDLPLMYSKYAEYNIQVIEMAYLDYMTTGNTDFIKAHWSDLLNRSNGNRNYLYSDSLLSFESLCDYPIRYRDNYDASGDPDNVTNAWNYEILNRLVVLAKALGKTTEGNLYQQQADTLFKQYNEAFWNGALQKYVDGGGTTHAAAGASYFPAAFNLVPPERQTAVGDYIVSRGMACNVYGAQFLWDALYNLNRPQAALDLLLSREIRSYYHVINVDHATTATETWNRESNWLTMAHPWGSSGGNVIAKHLMGISALEPGFRTVSIKPQMGNLADASIDFPTIRGNVHVDFRRPAAPSLLRLNVSIPVTSSGVVVIPKLKTGEVSVTESGRVIWQQGTFIKGAAGIGDAKQDSASVTFYTGAGNFAFETYSSAVSNPSAF